MYICCFNDYCQEEYFERGDMSAQGVGYSIRAPGDSADDLDTHPPPHTTRSAAWFPFTFPTCDVEAAILVCRP